jgi:hypothetical protein
MMNLPDYLLTLTSLTGGDFNRNTVITLIWQNFFNLFQALALLLELTSIIALPRSLANLQ